MKKHLLMLLGTLIALPALARDFTYTYEGQTITYTVINEEAKTCKTKDGERDNPGNLVSGKLILPSNPKDGETEFTLSKIGNYAFIGCSELTSVTIPNSVKSIGRWAFSGCIGLTSIVIPSSATMIFPGVFAECSGLTSVTIPNSVKTIGSDAFRGCSGLTSVTIPNSVTEISDATFIGCSGLTSVTIPSSVTKIGSWAFYGCNGLTSVTIPHSVTEIFGGAFGNCENLTAINVDYANSQFTAKDGVLYSMDYYTKEIYQLIQYPAGKKQQKFEIPSSVTTIHPYAFSGCNDLTWVTIGNSVNYIGMYAFYGCSGLTSIIIPNSITSIEGGAFEDCIGLTSIYIPNTVTSISREAFSGCSGLTSVTIPDSVTGIGSYAFRDCSGLTSITIPNLVTVIGREAFNGCNDLTSVTYLAEEPLDYYNYEIFDTEVYENATLNYLKSAEEKIAATEPWCLFKNRIGRDADFKDDSSISEVRNAEAGPTVVYDMRGVKVGESTEGLPRGIYIVKSAAKTTKIAI